MKEKGIELEILIEIMIEIENPLKNILLFTIKNIKIGIYTNPIISLLKECLLTVVI